MVTGLKETVMKKMEGGRDHERKGHTSEFHRSVGGMSGAVCQESKKHEKHPKEEPFT